MKFFEFLKQCNCKHTYNLEVALPLGTTGGRTYYAIEERCRRCGKETQYIQPINQELATILAVIKEEQHEKNL